MASLNKACLIGNLGADPEIRETGNDVKVATISIATTEKYTDKDGNKQEKTEWHRIVLWRGLAEIVERYVKKGDKLYIEGKITNRSYETNTGEKRYITEIIANNMVMLGGSRQSSSSEYPNSSTPQVPATNQQEPAGLESDDDLPF